MLGFAVQSLASHYFSFFIYASITSPYFSFHTPVLHYFPLVSPLFSYLPLPSLLCPYFLLFSLLISYGQILSYVTVVCTLSPWPTAALRTMAVSERYHIEKLGFVLLSYFRFVTCDVFFSVLTCNPFFLHHLISCYLSSSVAACGCVRCLRRCPQSCCHSLRVGEINNSY